MLKNKFSKNLIIVRFIECLQQILLILTNIFSDDVIINLGEFVKFGTKNG